MVTESDNASMLFRSRSHLARAERGERASDYASRLPRCHLARAENAPHTMLVGCLGLTLLVQRENAPHTMLAGCLGLTLLVQKTRPTLCYRLPRSHLGRAERERASHYATGCLGVTLVMQRKNAPHTMLQVASVSPCSCRERTRLTLF